jgi:hypothetical protein
MNEKVKKTIKEYAIITVSILLMAVGVYFFKFPNNFSFGGVTGYSKIVSKLTPLSASRFTMITNIVLLVVGFLMVGKSFGIKTVYASIVFSYALDLMERYIPLHTPVTNQPLLELVFAIFIPGVATAILFNIGASSGGTDIIALILKKYTSFNIGTVLLIVDLVAVLLSFFIFDIQTGLFSLLGLLAKSLVIDDVIESINMCKCFTIICENPEPICKYIIEELHRSATTYNAEGAYAHHKKRIILATMNSAQALKLRNYIRITEPHAFMIITKSSEIIGKGFLNR